MNTIMSARRTNSDGTSDRLFDVLIGRMDRQDDRLNAIYEQTRATNGKVIRNSARLDALENGRKQDEISRVERTPFYKDPSVIQFAILVAAVVAAIIGVDVSGVL